MSKEPSSKGIVIPNSVINSTGIITAPGLGERILSGRRGYLNRGVWPLEVRVDGKRIIDPVQMRNDYLDIPDLARPLIERSDESSFLIWRTEIPMNLGVGWYENGKWYLHPDDTLSKEGLKEVPLLDMSPTGLIEERVIVRDGPIPKEHYAVLTSCLGKNKFDEDLTIKGDYDPRHLTMLRYHEPSTVQKQEDFADHPDNQLLVEFARLFLIDRKRYIEKIRDYVRANTWSNYTRTLMVTGDKGVELHSFKGTSPRSIVESIQQQTESEDFTIFNLVQGGSFSFGLVSNGEVYEVGIRDPRNYHRPPQGLWLGWIEIDKKYESEVIKVGVNKLSKHNVK